jgi:sulfite reductase (ferredoxin)
MTETAAQRVERVKRERAPWSIVDDIRRYAREGFESIPDEDLNIRFRHWGLYTQGDGEGVRGDAVRYFMMRVRTPNGALTAPMVRTIADLSDRYARGSLDITNRQNFQLHWLRIEDIPAVWDALATVGWTSMGACGDDTRTVTGCPLAGVDADEIIDASPTAIAVDRHMNGNALYANLPRKFKITVSGCAHWCTYPEINDIGLTAVRRGDEVGYSVRVGGGLSTRPHFGVRLNVFVRAHQVTRVVEAIAAIFRDSTELRRNRAKARMKFLFLTQGWTAQWFLDEIVDRMGVVLEPAVEERPPRATPRDHVGVHAQKQPGLVYAGFAVPAGHITPDGLRRVADLAERYGDGTLRTTIMQNIIALNIPEDRVPALTREAANLPDGIALDATPFRRGVISCTGSQYCKLAVVETKAFSGAIVSELERRLPGFNEQVKVHVTGCPNACGQHWIADIGLQGVQIEHDGTSVDGFDFFLGGAVGAAPRLARRIGLRLPATDAASALERMFRVFLGDRRGAEQFPMWVARTGDDAVKRALAGHASG